MPERWKKQCEDHRQAEQQGQGLDQAGGHIGRDVPDGLFVLDAFLPEAVS